ncbi:MAG: hypothetical protein WCX84_09270 [Syntrophales bacterium]|jgi:hypothetical protein|nr:hypothetical protein [Syntrophales bacterium]NLN59113.1 DUF2802 domain-containing protein [Deltaproteobacteria bacterium]
MNIQLLLITQIAVEVILCIAVLFLLFRDFRGSRGAPPPPLPDEDDLSRFRALLDESREECKHFQETLDRGRKTLGDMIRQIDDREKALGALLAEAAEKLDRGREGDSPGGAEANLRYRDAVRLIRQGESDREVARACGVTDGELALIKGLLNAGSEQA